MEFGDDARQHAIKVGQDVVVPESDDPPTTRGEPRCPASIRRIVEMLTAISLNNQSFLDAGKVEDEGTKRMLAFEFVAMKMATSERGP